MIIYKITNKNTGLCYIGQTTGKLTSRWHRHKTTKSCQKLFNAIQKYGPDAFSQQIIGTYTTLDDLNNAEEYFIDFYNSLSPNGYNLHTGGNNHKVSEETRLKQSLAHIGKHHAGTFKKGYKESTETKNKRIEALSGKKIPVAVREKMSASQKKVIHTEEWNRNVSKGLLSKKLSICHKLTLSKAKKGKPWSKLRREAFEKTKVA